MYRRNVRCGGGVRQSRSKVLEMSLWKHYGVILKETKGLVKGLVQAGERQI